ncbi:winged helix-turn-helix transcriptional regulator [bacterium]|nr:winged helix-turn-helix transcriptional regulator [bacterium]
MHQPLEVVHVVHENLLATRIGHLGRPIILFHLFASGTLRFSQIQRAIVGVSEKIQIQQIRELERDGVVHRHVYAQVPPKGEYSLTELGLALCPALDELLLWAKLRTQK